jgi:hypothetical protein
MSRFSSAIVLTIVAGLFLCASAWAAGKKPVFIFASEEEGRSILTARDDFIQNMSPVDRAVRMRSEKPVSVDEFLKFVGNNVTAWQNEDKEQLQGILNSLAPKFEAYAPYLPDTIYLVRTTGSEEGGVAYTRGNAIVFPRRLPMSDVVGLYKLLSHELFHVITRQNKHLKEELYGIVGFKKCPAYSLPKNLDYRRITNPDAPLNEYCIQVRAAKTDIIALPLLYSQVDTYSKRDGEELFDYLQTAYISIARIKNPGHKLVMLKDREMALYKEEELQNLYEQIGQNTDYTIHPEEILADNFSYLFLGVTEIESPRIIEKMKKVLKKTGDR